MGTCAGVVLERAPKSGACGVVPEDPPKENAAGVATAGTGVLPNAGIILEVVPPLVPPNEGADDADALSTTVLLPKDVTGGAILVGAFPLDDAPNSNGTGALIAAGVAPKLNVPVVTASVGAGAVEPN